MSGIRSIHTVFLPRISVKIVCLVISLTIFIPSIHWAFDIKSYQFNGLRSINHLGQVIELPKKFVNLHSSFQGQNKTIIHIQDLHCNYEVQMNIAKTIDHLVKKYDLNLVGQEGAFHTVNTSKLSTFPDNEVRKDVADYLVKEGKLTGAEYYSATSQNNVQLVGIETPELYYESHKQVRSFLNSESQGYCYDLRETLDQLKPMIYNDALKNLDKKNMAFRQGKIRLIQYVYYLRAKAEYLNIKLESFSQIKVLVNHKDHFRQINQDDLYQEINQIEGLIRQQLYTTLNQQALDLHYHRLDVIEKLLNISVTPNELQDFRENRDMYKIGSIIAFVDSVRAFCTLNTGIKDTMPLQVDTEVFKLDSYLCQVEKFYQLADQRSDHFVTNLLKKMDRMDENLAVMIGGGFHNEKVLTSLKQQNITYVSIKPKLTRQDLVNPYFSLLQNRQMPLEVLLAKNQNIMAVPTECVDLQGFVTNQVVPSHRINSVQKISRQLKDLLLKSRLLIQIAKSKKVSLQDIPQVYAEKLMSYTANGNIQLDVNQFQKLNQDLVQSHSDQPLPVVALPMIDQEKEITTLAIVDPKAVSMATVNNELQRIKLGKTELLFYGEKRKGLEVLTALLDKNNNNKWSFLIPNGMRSGDYFGWQGKIVSLSVNTMPVVKKIAKHVTGVSVAIILLNIIFSNELYHTSSLVIIGIGLILSLILINSYYGEGFQFAWQGVVPWMASKPKQNQAIDSSIMAMNGNNQLAASGTTLQEEFSENKALAGELLKNGPTGLNVQVKLILNEMYPDREWSLDLNTWTKRLIDGKYPEYAVTITNPLRPNDEEFNINIVTEEDSYPATFRVTAKDPVTHEIRRASFEVKRDVFQKKYFVSQVHGDLGNGIGTGVMYFLSQAIAKEKDVESGISWQIHFTEMIYRPLTTLMNWFFSKIDYRPMESGFTFDTSPIEILRNKSLAGISKDRDQIIGDQMLTIAMIEAAVINKLFGGRRPEGIENIDELIEQEVLSKELDADTGKREFRRIGLARALAHIMQYYDTYGDQKPDSQAEWEIVLDKLFLSIPRLVFSNDIDEMAVALNGQAARGNPYYSLLSKLETSLPTLEQLIEEALSQMYRSGKWSLKVADWESTDSQPKLTIPNVMNPDYNIIFEAKTIEDGYPKECKISGINPFTDRPFEVVFQLSQERVNKSFNLSPIAGHLGPGAGLSFFNYLSQAIANEQNGPWRLTILSVIYPQVFGLFRLFFKNIKVSKKGEPQAIDFETAEWDVLDGSRMSAVPKDHEAIISDQLSDIRRIETVALEALSIYSEQVEALKKEADEAIGHYAFKHQHEFKQGIVTTGRHDYRKIALARALFYLNNYYTKHPGKKPKSKDEWKNRLAKIFSPIPRLVYETDINEMAAAMTADRPDEYNSYEPIITTKGGIMPDEENAWQQGETYLAKNYPTIGEYLGKHYGTLVAWWWEFYVSLKQWYAWVLGLAFASLTLFVFGDAELAAKIFLAPTWITFFYLHFKQDASFVNKWFALGITILNLSLIIIPTITFPWMVLIGLFGHAIVNGLTVMSTRLLLDLNILTNLMNNPLVQTPEGLTMSMTGIEMEKEERSTAHKRESVRRWNDSLQKTLLEASDLAHLDQQGTEAHYAQLGQEIESVMESAPKGKPIVIYGAGALRDIPDSLLKNKDVPQIILIDGSKEVMKKVLEKRLLDPQEKEKINLVEFDLSLASEEFIHAVIQVIDVAEDLDEAKQEITNVLKKFENDVITINLPKEMQQHDAGLVVSSMVFPSLTTSLTRNIHWLLAKRFDLELPNDRDGLILHQDQEYLKAFNKIALNLMEAHNLLLLDTSAPNGHIYFSSSVATLDRAFMNTFFPDGEQVLIDEFNDAMKNAKDHHGEFDIRRDDYENIHNMYQYRANPQVPINWTIPNGPILNLPGSFWIKDMQVLAANTWLWNYHPDRTNVRIIQSLHLKPKEKTENNSSPNSIAYFWRLYKNPTDIEGAIKAGKQGLKWEIPTLLITGIGLGLLGLHWCYAAGLGAFVLVHQLLNWQANQTRGPTQFIAYLAKQLVVFLPYAGLAVWISINGLIWEWVMVLALLAVSVHIGYDLLMFKKYQRLTQQYKLDFVSKGTKKALTRWQASLQQILRSQFMKNGQSEINHEGDEQHYMQLRKDIETVVEEESPINNTIVVYGAGALRDIPDAVLKNKDAHDIILVDISIELMEKALADRELTPTERKKIKLEEYDLSLTSPMFINDVIQAIDSAKDLENAGRNLIKVYRTLQDSAFQIRLPTFDRQSEAGLVISSMLFPNVSTAFAMTIHRLIAERFDLLDVDGSIGLDTQQNIMRSFGDQYQDALMDVVNELLEAHNQLLLDTTASNGAVYISTILLSMDRVLFNNINQMMLPAFEEAVVAASRNPETFSLDDYEGVNHLYALGEQLPVKWTIPDGPILNLPGSIWTKGMKSEGTDIWPWYNDPFNVRIVQSLYLKPHRVISPNAIAYFWHLYKNPIDMEGAVKVGKQGLKWEIPMLLITDIGLGLMGLDWWIAVGLIGFVMAHQWLNWLTDSRQQPTELLGHLWKQIIAFLPYFALASWISINGLTWGWVIGLGLIAAGIHYGYDLNEFSKKIEIKNSSQFVTTINLNKIQLRNNETVIADRIWLFDKWPELGVVLLFAAGVILNLGNITVQKMGEGNLEQRLSAPLLKYLPLNSFDLNDLIRHQKGSEKIVEIRQLNPNINLWHYLILLINGRCWINLPIGDHMQHESNEANYALYLPAQLVQLLQSKSGEQNTLAYFMLRHILSLAGNRYFNQLYTNNHQVGIIQKLIDSNTDLELELLKQASGHWDQNLHQFAIGHQSASYQMIQWGLKALLTTEDEQAIFDYLRHISPSMNTNVYIGDKKYVLPRIIFERQGLLWLLQRKYHDKILRDKKPLPQLKPVKQRLNQSA